MADPGPRRGDRPPGARRERLPREAREREAREARDARVREVREARGRQRRGRAERVPLSEDAVVEAGLAVLRRSGIEAVTMRAVAQELDTGAASLYVYVKGRDELFALLFDRVAAMVDYPKPDPARWRDQLITVCGDMLGVLEAHPGLAATTLGNVPSGPHAMDGAESVMALLLAGGAEPQRAAWAADTLFLIVVANALESGLRDELAERGAGHSQHDKEHHRAFFGHLDADRYPTLRAHADVLVGGEGRDRFLFSIETVIDGVVARANGAGKAPAGDG